MVSYEKQKIILDGVSNARQLGGYRGTDGRRIKNNVLLRTGTLFAAPSDTLRKLSEVYRVSDIADLRMDQETATMPEPHIEGANYHHLSVLNNLPITKEDFELYKKLLKSDNLVLKYQTIYEQKIPIDMEQNYKTMVFSDEGKDGYKKFFEILLNKPENGAVLFHCTQGKDRTGTAAILILSALGVDRETIIADYMLTNKAYGFLLDGIRSELEAANVSKEVLDCALMLESVSEGLIVPMLEDMDREYGSVQGYLKEEFGLTESDMKQLNELYLEK
ncbi:MAG: tyrosine-protein phosphatase [Clostridia bacterium]|nr:tyrosine-protein phosphatase [Clostridia bacterium]MBQ6531318.1 tyrosine-protein phosphatase [Clostridia bacterium]MBQ9599005.1 tyrosine-protein phosphatase [Clostridia bacterium]MBR0470397.1 tyrosine-protein phosphatase [Clostridia bacterium]